MPPAPSGTWSSHFDGDGCCSEKDSEEPELPDALVPIESVSNGCGGGKASLEGKYGDTSVYLDLASATLHGARSG